MTSPIFSSLFFFLKNHPKSIYNNILSRKKNQYKFWERVKSCKTKKKWNYFWFVHKAQYIKIILRWQGAEPQCLIPVKWVWFRCGIYVYICKRFLEKRRGEWDHVSIYLLFVKGKLYIYIIQGQRCYQPFPYIIPRYKFNTKNPYLSIL